MSSDDPAGTDENGHAGQTDGQTGGQVGGQPDQPQGQPGQGGQTQPGQGRAQPVETGPSATDVLSRPAGQSVIKYVVGIFAVVGVGIGLTAVLANSLLGDTGTGFLSGIIVLMAFGVAMFGGSFLAAVVGLQDFLQIGEVDNQTYVLAFASNAAGFLVMGIIVAIFVSIAMGSGSGGGGGDLGDFIVSAIVMAIPAGVVGAGVTWLRDWQHGVTTN